MLVQTQLQYGAAASPRTAWVAPGVANKRVQCSINLMGTPMHFDRNSEIYGEGEFSRIRVQSS